MGAIASQITSLTIVYATVYSDADQRKHQSAASLAFVRGTHRSPVNFHKWPVTRKMFPFDDVIMRRFDSPVPDCWLLACDFDIFGYVIIKSLEQFSFYLSYFLPLFTVSCMKPVIFLLVITFSYTKCFVHSYTVDVVFTLSSQIYPVEHNYKFTYPWYIGIKQKMHKSSLSPAFYFFSVSHCNLCFAKAIIEGWCCHTTYFYDIFVAIMIR